jgi:hypothetical protein
MECPHCGVQLVSPEGVIYRLPEGDIPEEKEG